MTNSDLFVPSVRRAFYRIVALGFLVFLGLAAPVQAGDDLGAPSGKVILSISGGSVTNVGAHAAFDRDMLQKLPQRSMTVVTPWTKGKTEFTGPLLIDVLKQVGGTSGAKLTATALNDYAVDIPMEDLRAYDVILAMKMNGKVLRVRDKGPLWVIYPWTDAHPELRDERYHGRSIWQLSKIDIH